MKTRSHTTPAQRLLLGAGVVLLGLFVGSAAARADAIGALEPMAAEVCGGSYHSPNCSRETFLSGVCAVGSVVLAGAGFLVFGWRRKRRDEH